MLNIYKTMFSLMDCHNRRPSPCRTPCLCLVSGLAGVARMFGSQIPLLLALAALVGGLPSGNVSSNALSHAFAERGIFGPIAIESAAGIAGGQIACASPPLSSFFVGLKPPVRDCWDL